MALSLTWLYYVEDITERSRKKIRSMMVRYFEQWVVKTYVAEEQQYSGWYDDHHVDHYVVGWATSIVCHFLANYYWILGHEVNRLVIESLGLEDSAEHYSFDDAAPSRARRTLDGKRPNWADLPTHAWDPNKTVEDVTAELRGLWTDPSRGKEISQDLAKKIIGPILDSSGAGPARSRCSAMLNGPPGAGKTSLVRQIARVVRWPLVTVRGSVILAGDRDDIEARDIGVFGKLRLLSNCVLFFDECEEFFRVRDAPQVRAVDNRRIAALVRTGILRRLQDLHDERRCLVFLDTNFPEVIDVAVRRAGCFDFQLDVKHPLPERAVEFLDEPDSKIRREVEILAKDRVPTIVQGVKEAIRNYVAKNGRETPIPFKNIENALRSAARASESQIESYALRELERGIEMDAPDLSQLD
jgi:SpoVK/Ycf46/Vps4 family AAA+-type ATPase